MRGKSRLFAAGTLVAAIVVAACGSSSTPPTTPSPEPAPTTIPAGIAFEMKEAYRLGEPIEVIIHNQSTTATYYYQSYYPACYNLKFFDASAERRPYPHATPGANPPRLLLPGQFIIPRGTHCDLIFEKELRPGEEAVLLTWNQEMCIRDNWGCIGSVQVNPGAYRVVGEFAQTKGVVAPGVSRENATNTPVEWRFVIESQPAVVPSPGPTPSLCGPTAGELPCGPRVTVGTAYPFLLYTHCGVRSAYFNGQRWIAAPILNRPDNVSVPPWGWDDPFDLGAMVLLHPDLARFTSRTGQAAAFRPLAPGEEYPWTRPCI